MDTKSKNSRKFGILILILLLAASSAVMMLQYGTIRRQIESVQEEGSRSGETAADMANTLAEGNYLLYNRYVRDTDPAEVLSLYGQQRFEDGNAKQHIPIQERSLEHLQYGDVL